MPRNFVDVGLSTRMDASPPDPANPRQDADDGYPGVYPDQRTMLAGGLECETGEDVFWKCWVPFLEKFQNIGPTLDDRTLTPYLNQSRWVADCPACRSGIACWDRNPYACCLGCGRMYNVVWQPPRERSEVLRLLAGRPPGNRNWDGETADELKVQNVLMAGVGVAERNGLLVAENVTMPDEFTDVTQYLETLRRERPDRVR